MKKLLALLLALIMIFNLAACNNKDDDDDDCKHKDKNEDGICDKCDEKIKDESTKVDGTKFLGNVLNQFANAKTFRLNFTTSADVTSDRWVSYDENHIYTETPRKISETNSFDLTVDFIISLTADGVYNGVITGSLSRSSDSTDNGEHNFANDVEVYIIDRFAYEYDKATNTHTISEGFDYESFEALAAAIVSNPGLSNADLASALSKISGEIYKSFNFKNNTGKITIDLKPTLVNVIASINGIGSDTIVSEAINKLIYSFGSNLTTDDILSILEEYADLTVKEALLRISEELEKSGGVSLKVMFESITSNPEIRLIVADIFASEFGDEAYDIMESFAGMTFEEVIDQTFEPNVSVYELLSEAADLPSKDEAFSALRDMLALTVGEFESNTGSPVFSSLKQGLGNIEVNALKADITASITKKGELKSLDGVVAVDINQNTVSPLNNQMDHYSVKFDLDFTLCDISSTAKSISLPAGSKLYENLNIDYELVDQYGNRIGDAAVRFDGTCITLDEGIEINTHEYNKQADGRTLVIPASRITSVYLAGTYADPSGFGCDLILNVDPYSARATMSYAYLDTLRSMMEDSISFTGACSVYNENGIYVGEVSIDSDGYAYIEILENNVRFEGNMTLDKTSRVAIMYSEYVTYAKANDKDITDYGGRFLLRYDFSAGHAVLEETMRYTIPVDFTGDYMVYNTQGTLLGYMSIYSNGSAWIENTNFNNARVTISINSYNVEDNTTISIPSDQIAAVYDHYSGTDVELYGSTVYLYVDTNSMSAVMECDYIEDRMLLRNTTNYQFELLTQDNRVVGYVTVYGDQSSRVTISGSDYHFTLPSFDYVNENGEVSFAYYNVSMYYRDVYCESTYALTYRFDFLNGDCYVDSPHVSAAIFTTAYFEALDQYGNVIGYLSVQPSDYNKFTIRLDYDDKDCYFYATNINVGAFTESGFIIYSNELYIMPYSDSDRVNQPSSNLVVTYGSEPYVVIVDYYFEGVSVW